MGETIFLILWYGKYISFVIMKLYFLHEMENIFSTLWHGKYIPNISHCNISKTYFEYCDYENIFLAMWKGKYINFNVTMTIYWLHCDIHCDNGKYISFLLLRDMENVLHCDLEKTFLILWQWKYNSHIVKERKYVS